MDMLHIGSEDGILEAIATGNSHTLAVSKYSTGQALQHANRIPRAA